MAAINMTRESISYRRLSQRDVHLIATRHEMLYAGRMGGARASFAFCDLSGLDLSNRVLNDADFSGAVLGEAKLSGAKLDNANFFAADMRRCDFSGASMRRVDLRGASLRGANLTGADMFEADMREGVIAERDRREGLRYLRHEETPTELPAAMLANANLGRARMTGVIALQADFSDAMMRGCRLTRANLRQANMSGAIMEDADLSGEPAVGMDTVASQRLWQVRESVGDVLGAYGPPLKFDVSLPLAAIESTLNSTSTAPAFSKVSVPFIISPCLSCCFNSMNMMW